MNIIYQIARILDNQGAYTDHYTLPSTVPNPKTGGQMAWQNYYEGKAKEILKAILGSSMTQIKDDIMAHERTKWKRVGFPVGKYPELDAHLQEIINNRYKGTLNA